MTPFLIKEVKGNGVIPLPLKAFTGNGMIIERKAQSAVWGLLSILVLVVIAGGLVDIYRMYAARNWAYSVAQEAALAGASRGRDWDAVLNTGFIQLDQDVASIEAQKVVNSAIQTRGITGYSSSIRVLPDPFGWEEFSRIITWIPLLFMGVFLSIQSSTLSALAIIGFCVAWELKCGVGRMRSVQLPFV